MAANPSAPFEACDETVQLLAQQILCLCRQNAGERGNLFFDLSRIEGEPIQRDERRQTGE